MQQFVSLALVFLSVPCFIGSAFWIVHLKRCLDEEQLELLEIEHYRIKYRIQKYVVFALLFLSGCFAAAFGFPNLVLFNVPACIATGVFEVMELKSLPPVENWGISDSAKLAPRVLPGLLMLAGVAIYLAGAVLFTPEWPA